MLQMITLFRQTLHGQHFWMAGKGLQLALLRKPLLI